jgi:hypothetical protein
VKLAVISAAEWNAARALLLSNRPLSGTGVRLMWTPDGVWVALTGDSAFRHPWELSCRWRLDDKLALGGEWVATVRPGFVNGRDVTVAAPRPDGSAPSRQQIALTDEEPPELALGGYRDPTGPGGFGATEDGELITMPGEGYPRFFEQLGVKPAWKGGKLGADEPESDPNRTRQIRASDIVLITPRIGARQQVEVRDPFTEAQSVEISTIYLNGRLASAPSRNYLVSLPRWTPTAGPSAFDKLMGTAVETEQDELLIATVYFISPEDTPDDAEVDAMWTPYPAYSVFWNLNWASREQTATAPSPPISLHTGLAAGVADSLFNFLLSPVNDFFNQVESFLGAADFSGKYWTT